MASREGIDAVFFPRKRGALLASRFGIFRGQVRFGCGHSQNYGVRLLVQAKARRSLPAESLEGVKQAENRSLLRAKDGSWE